MGALRAEGSSWKMPQQNDSTRSRDHLANERTFLAWVRTGLAVVVFGFAIGRFAIAIREFAQAQGHPERTAGLSVWLGVLAIVTGIVLTFAGLNRYRRTRARLESGRFEPAGSVIDLVAIFYRSVRPRSGCVSDIRPAEFELILRQVIRRELTPKPCAQE